MVAKTKSHTTPYVSREHRAALAIAGRGKPVFPCKPDKSPYTPNGFKGATAHPPRVTALWTKYRGEKIGMPTGSASGVFVVDVDRLEALGELPRELPETLTIRTKSGGLHYYFEHVAGITNKRGLMPDGIDIRGDGGYVIVAPSEGYTVERRAPIADAPEWLLEIIRDKPETSSGARRSSTVGIADDGGPIPSGRRNETLASVAGRLHDGTRDLGQLETDLLAVNDARCSPPLPDGEVRKIAASIFRRDPCQPARRPFDAETIAALERAERAISSGEWRGRGGKTRYSIAVAALKLARKYGTRVEDGVRVSVSARQLALAAGVSRSSITRNIPLMGDVLRPDNDGVEAGKSGAIMLLCPPARTDTTLPTEARIRSDTGGCVSWRAPLSAPRLRWSSPKRKPSKKEIAQARRVNSRLPDVYEGIARLGKGCERALDVLEAAGGRMRLASLADALGVSLPKELTRRRKPESDKGRDGIITKLVDAGIVVLVGEDVMLVDDWLEALDREREIAGEIAAYRRDMSDYNRDRAEYRNRKKVKPTDHWTNNPAADGCIEDLSPVEDEPGPRSETEPEPKPALSPLATALCKYLNTNPQDACQKPYWLGQTLYVYDWHPKATPDEVKAAIEELGGEWFLRERLRGEVSA